MDSKVTLQDIAEKAGVHRSTVALALRDHPRISIDVRRRIQEIAKEKGYRINPLVAALMQSRRSKRITRDVVIAYVTCHPTRYGWRPPHHDRPDYFPGALARAKELGYKIEHFWLAEPGMTPGRFSDILTTRHISGLLMGRLPPGLSEAHLHWDRFSCVALGRTLRTPRLHYVTEDQYAGAALAVREMVARGFKRIGFVSTGHDDSPGVLNRWLGGFLREQLKLGQRDQLPPCLYQSEPDADNALNFADWHARWKPDALIVTEMPPFSEWLKKIKMPAKNLPVATLVNDHLDEHWTGIYCDPAKLGALAVEMLVGMMHRGETGIPNDPHEILLSGKWIHGTTL